MQAFYPPPPRRTLLLALLALMVLVLHGWGLRSLSTSWPQTSTPSASVHIQLQAPAAVTAAMNNVTTPVKPVTRPRTPTTRPTPTTQAVANEPVVSTSTNTAPATTAPEIAATNTAPTPAEPTLAPAAEMPAEPVAVQQPPGSTWLTDARFVWPASVKLVFDFVGESKGIRYNAEGDLMWQHDGHNYQMRQEVRHLLLGARSQTSVGTLGAQGLQPLRFGDKYKQEMAAHFERDKNLISFSNNAASQTLQAGAQDRLSLFAQFASVLAGSPLLRQAKQPFQLQVASARSADVWTFVVEKQETLKLPIGTLPTLKLSRVPTQQYDQTIEIWLSPSHGYLPVKVRIAQTNGDVLEQFLRKVETP